VRVVLGVTGCIGAYKAIETLRGLTRGGAEVSVVMTTAATRFVTPLTFQTLSGRRVSVGALQDPGETGIEHIDLAREADLLVVAPATADILGKFAQGIADDFLSTLYTAVTSPVLVAPAMNVRMYLSGAVQANLELLRGRGVHVVGPGEGWLACGEEGWGRMAEPEEVVAAALAIVRERDRWRGVRVLVTAGPTREPIDAARFLSNRSSGRMGFALAAAAARRGAEVTLIAGPTPLPTPPGVRRVDVVTALDMAREVDACFERIDVLLMAAAVADFRVAQPVAGKVKKTDTPSSLLLEPNPDILAAAGAHKGERILVGFAAETDDLLGEARRKLVAKRADLIVANDIGRPDIGFESADNEATLVESGGRATPLPRMSKARLADEILEWVERVRASREAPV
jgi:phosphopantothenoylcysteine decarboxylase/phosphopantothenate--cysteine ligase